MNKSLICLAAVLLLSGCMSHPDKKADRAAVNFLNARKKLPEKALTLAEVLKQHPEKTPEIRRLFAGSSTAKAQNDRAGMEIYRVKLNALLDHLPSDKIDYDCRGALDCPEELPPVTTVEKAALILDQGKTPVVELLSKIRICHAEAIRAMQDRSTPQAKLDYFLACMKLADALGVDLPDLEKLSGYEKRFDGALKWRKKVQNEEK